MVGSWVVSNNMVIKVLSIDYSIDDTLKVQFNEGQPFEVLVEYDEEGEGFARIGNVKYYLNECMRAM